MVINVTIREAGCEEEGEGAMSKQNEVANDSNISNTALTQSSPQ